MQNLSKFKNQLIRVAQTRQTRPRKGSEIVLISETIYNHFLSNETATYSTEALAETLCIPKTKVLHKLHDLKNSGRLTKLEDGTWKMKIK